MPGAALRPIAGKRGSHRYCAGPEAGYISVGAGKRGSHRYCVGPETGYISVGAGLPAMRPVLTTQPWGQGSSYRPPPK